MKGWEVHKTLATCSKVKESAEHAESVILKAMQLTVHICNGYKVCVSFVSVIVHPDLIQIIMANNNGSVLKLDGDIPCGIPNKKQKPG